MHRVLLLLASALLSAPACAGDPARDPSDLVDDQNDEELELGDPCLDTLECPTGAFCVGEPCSTDPDNVDGDQSQCGVFTCRLECASMDHLLCTDTFSCCSGDQVCGADNRCEDV